MDIKKKKRDEICMELKKGMQLAKCRKCGCMKETLENISASLHAPSAGGAAELEQEVQAWLQQMETIKYACLGCEYCYPAVAANLFSEIAPIESLPASAGCGFSVKNEKWPPVAGEYFVTGEGPDFPVAVSTLASPELSEVLAQRKPEGLCLTGKTETENIGIDKIIKNTITNPFLRFLFVAGCEPSGHFSGKTLLALSKNGVDNTMKIIGSTGRRPVLKNVSRADVEAFRKQITVVNMIGCEDVFAIENKILELTQQSNQHCECMICEVTPHFSHTLSVPVISAQRNIKLRMDKAGYFVILPQPEKQNILVEHYAYDNTLLHIVEGKDAPSLYLTLIHNGWITELTHAAYLGRELAKAAFCLKNRMKFVQDGAAGDMEELPSTTIQKQEDTVCL